MEKPWFNIEDLINASVHEHAWYMDIKATSEVRYILSCSICDTKLCLGYWSLKTGHRYCVENMHHHEPQDLIIPITMAKTVIFQ